MDGKSERRWSVRTASEATAIGVAVVYLLGYLVLRTEITVLGIPAGVNTFDDRYLFAGASFLLHAVNGVTRLLPAVAVVILLLLAVWRITRSIDARGRLAILIRWSTHRIVLKAASAAIALSSIMYMRLWVNEQNLLLGPRNDGLLQTLVTSPHPDGEGFWLFLRHLGALMGASTFLILSRRDDRTASKMSLAAGGAVLAQFITLAMLSGALGSVGERPRLMIDGEASGLLVWEDSESYIVQMEDTPGLVRRSKADVKRATFRGVGRLRFTSSAVQTGNEGRPH